MITENLSTLKIHKLTQEQYDRELAAGRIDPNALYLTPDEEIDLSGYVTSEDLLSKADAVHTHAISDVTNLQSTIDSTLASAKSYTDSAVANKADKIHTHDDRYYTEAEVDTKLSDVNTSITDITSGTTKVAKASHADEATHATSADSATTATSATKATQDGNGKVISSTYETKADASSKLTEAKTYTDEKVANLLNNSTEAVDSIMELAEAMKDNADAIEALETVAASKVPTSRKINGKALTSDITLSASDVGADASGSAGAVQTNLDTHASNTTLHITATERTNWNAAKTHADSAHAPSNAQANVIESIKVNGTAQTITSKSVNITVPTDNASLTNGAGYITSSAITNKADKATTLSGYGITNAYTKTEMDAALAGKSASGHGHDAATTSAAGFMTAAMVSKLNGIAEGATKITVDTALSASSTNPVQNKAVNSAISTLTSAVTANTNSITTHNTAITNLQTAVNEIQEITSAEISALFD